MKKIEFSKSVFQSQDLPKDMLPEIVLCGRSNVGKSTFINSLFNRKNLAKTSSHPGKTRSINFYKVEDKFYIVDLPGFGYAKVSKTEKDKWKQFITEYFQSKRNIVLAFHLIDSRHKPMPLDIELNEYLMENQIPRTAILNKVDKLKQGELKKAKTEAVKHFNDLIPGDNLLIYSAINGTGRNEIKNRLIKLFESVK
jgi:GTP-binding protein